MPRRRLRRPHPNLIRGFSLGLETGFGHLSRPAIAQETESGELPDRGYGNNQGWLGRLAQSITATRYKNPRCIGV